MDHNESADILGGRIQVLPPRPALWTDPGRITLLLGLAAAVALTWIRVGPYVRQWKETRYRKATRRRFGIPDDDHRPFNVAYAAALQKKREGKGRDAPPKPARDADGSPFLSIPDDIAEAASQPPTIAVRPGYDSGRPVATQGASHRALPSEYAIGPSAPELALHARATNVQSSSVGQSIPPTIGTQGGATRTIRGKHALDDAMDAEQETLAKETRVDAEVLDEPEWRDDGDIMEVDPGVQFGKRGSKRVASVEDDESLAFSRSERRDKRARKVSLDKEADAPDYDMEEEQEDDLDDTLGVARGKKRDRAEAGSTFGGDDSVVDDDDKPHRQRRRRTVSTKLTQPSSRGQKRVRDVESHDSDDSEVERPKWESTRKKRGKRSNEELAPISNDPLCKGRRIGEEWEVNGARFKVGPNGQRLRQELVKKSRSRFPMPSDSQHPDRRANVDVYVETWLSEEEYQAAKERHELAWQDASPTSPESHIPSDILDSPSKLGKNLLWSSTMSSRESPVKRGPLRQSISSNVGLRLSVIAPTPPASSRRISSVYQAPASPASDSPKLHKSKSYSKWEKQDLEAAAMSKIRVKQQQQIKAAPAPTTSTPPLFNAAPAPTPATKPEEKPAQFSAPSFGFPPAGASSDNASSKPVAEPPKLNIPQSNIPQSKPAEQSKLTAPSFSFPSTNSGASTAPSNSAGSASTAAQKPDSQSSSSVPNFFAKPPAPSPAAPAASNSVPNFFAKPAGAAAPAPAAPSANAPKATFSFAPSSAPASQPAQQPSNNPGAASGGKTEEPKQTPGASLLSRLGMGPPPAAQTPSGAASSTPTFSFAKPTPAAGSTSSTPGFGGAAANAQTNAESTKPTFSFGVSSKPATSTPTTGAANGTQANAASSAPSTSTPPGTTAPKFSFGLNNASSQPTASQPAASTPAAPASNPFQSSAANATNASSAPKSAFSFGSSSTSSSSPFGNASGNNAGSSPFGAPAGTSASNNASPFGGAANATTSASNASPFGAAANGTTKPAEAPKSAFSFGAPSTSSTDTSKPSEPAKSAFSFGGNASSSSSGSVFGGSAAQNSTTTKTETPASSSPFSFASSSTPSFGTSSATPTFGSKSAFGSTPTFGSTATPAAGASGTKSAFSFGNTSTANASGSTSSTTPATSAGKTESKPTFSFGFGGSSNSGNNATGSAAPSPSAFGFGAPSSSGNATTPAASSPFGAPAAQSGSGSTLGRVLVWLQRRAERTKEVVVVCPMQLLPFYALCILARYPHSPLPSPPSPDSPYARTCLSGTTIVHIAMLSTNSVTTPRPMPPAKSRKSSAMHYSRIAPPPPYAPPLSEVLLGSPVPVTAQLVNVASSSPDRGGADGSSQTDEWMDEKSREELSDLLLKADGMIKTRETELSYTSALCKSLYDDNVALKTKHEALLARLPPTGMSSPAPSVPTSPQIATLPSFTGVMFPSTSDESLQPLPASARLRHTRRISVTPAELAHLSDQNAELLDKLEQLEAESAKADQAGKRKLRKLEQEIQTLRDELEQTQARGAELEEQARVAVNAVQVQRRKEEREAWVRALKEKSASLSGSDFPGAEIRDFAPPPELPRSTPRKPTYAHPDPSETSVELSDISFEPPSFGEDTTEDDSTDQASYFSTPPTSMRDQPQIGLEYAIVSQLLSKIRELEETNAQIKEQQKATEERMRAAQSDVDSIKRVYDCLDVADIDIDDPEDEQPSRGSRVPSGGTIKFSSLRRTLIGDMRNLLHEESTTFAQGISRDMQSTVREDPTGHRGALGHKARKSVVGLFDPAPEPSAGTYPPSLSVSPNFRRNADAGDTSSWSIAATDGVAPPSPSLSTLQTPLDGPQTGRTLGSELGSEYGDNWPERGFNHHLRASSLYDLTGLNLSESSPGSPVESHAASPSIIFPTTDDDCAAGPSTPPRQPALQLNIEPPTPTPDRLRSPAAARQHRLSQTVRSRTHRWVEGRFQQESLRDNVLRKRQSTSLLGGRPTRSSSSSSGVGKAKGKGKGRADVVATLDETFDGAVSQVRRVRSRASLAALGFPVPHSPSRDGAAREEEDEPPEAADADKSLELRRLSQGEAAAVADPAKREGIVGLVLEAWLWLQFIIVVMLFLWAMAKRGPKVVLEAERRSAQRGTPQ
ncbi:hypothetical protein C8Q77DRAFT_1187433 [Trametes polyzona]|nr:hypothetical protein C8Q77DRAFT_1187433 [Trametes polyzona]